MVLPFVLSLIAADFLGVLASQSMEELASILNDIDALDVEGFESPVDGLVAREPQGAGVEPHHAWVACPTLLVQRELDGRGELALPSKALGEFQAEEVPQLVFLLAPEGRALARAVGGVLLLPPAEHHVVVLVALLEHVFPSLGDLGALQGDNLHGGRARAVLQLALQARPLERGHFLLVIKREPSRESVW